MGIEQKNKMSEETEQERIEALAREMKQMDNEPTARGKKSGFSLAPRISRAQFLSWLWLVIALSIAAWFIPDYVYLLPEMTVTTINIQLITFAAIVLLLVYLAAMRLRDMGRSGLFSLLLFIPFLNLLLTGLLLLAPGSRKKNRFGAPVTGYGTLTQVMGVYIPLLLVIAGGVGLYFHQEQALDQLSRLTIVLANN